MNSTAKKRNPEMVLGLAYVAVATNWHAGPVNWKGGNLLGQSATYRVVAAGTDLYNAKVTTSFISHANLMADFGKAEDVYLQLNLKPGANAPAAERAIRANAEDFKLVKSLEFLPCAASR
ncbi:MAG: hypothetical protein HGA26_00480 [Chlorobiaceae bacterium]|nr:hypothetical protein [Chlorobiaceae bacterium]